MNADNQDFKYKVQLTEENIRIFNAMVIELKNEGIPAVSQYAIKVLYESEVRGNSQ